MELPQLQRLDKRALFEALSYQPHAGQLLVHRCKAPRRVLACGVRWGKSLCAAMEAVAALMEPRGSAVGWIVAPNYGVTERVFDRVVGAFKTSLPHRIHELRDREHRLIVRNVAGGLSELHAKSGDNPDSLLGEGLDFAIVDEAAVMKPNIWREHIAQRLLDRLGWALLLSTPRGTNWFFDEFERAAQGDTSYQCWSSPSWCNPHIDRAWIEAERGRLPAEMFGELYGGEFRGARRPRCRTCGYPDRNAPGYLSIRGPEDVPSRCVACDELVDKEGRTLYWLRDDGRPHLFILDFGATREQAEDMHRAAMPGVPVERSRDSNWREGNGGGTAASAQA